MTTLQKATPRVETLLNLERRITELRAEQRSILGTIVQDAEWMGTPVHRIRRYNMDARSRRSVTAGTLCHILWQDNEWAPSMNKLMAHPADECDDHPECHQQNEAVKFPKYSHVGSRTLYSRLADAVCVGNADLADHESSFVFVSVSTGRPVVPPSPARVVRRRLEVDERLRDLDA